MSAKGPCDPVNNFETNSRHGVSAPGCERRKPSKSKPVGRYDQRTHNTRLPPNGLGKLPASKNTELVIAAIIDPLGDGEERLFASVNRRVDLLENERSRERISEPAYRAGRLIQEIFERLGRTSGSNWAGTSRTDPELTRQKNLVHALESARRAQELVERMRGRIGMIDTRLLQRLLGERLSFAECASLQGKCGEKGVSYIATRFREALEDLADSWVGIGKVIPAPDDKYLASTGDVDDRQAASIEKGVTAARKAAEIEQAKRGR